MLPRRVTGFAWVILVVSAVSCAEPIRKDSPPNVERMDGPGAAGAGGSGSGGSAGSSAVGGVDGPSAPPLDGPQPLDAGCPSGQHACQGKCVDSLSPENCGSSCEPCPAIKGGTRTCDGTRCGGQCPGGSKLCNGECVPQDQVCGACPAGTHDCNGICSDNMRVASCGTSCVPCTYPPGSTPTCDGTKCGFTCDTGKACGDRCGACCVAEDCPAQSGRTVACEQGTLTCRYACPEGTKDCNGQCIPSGSCCVDADCPMMAGQVGKCDSSSRMCGYSCAGDTKPCGGRCIPSGGCCDDNGCTGNHACQNNVCSGTACRAGYKACGTTCIPDAGCCEDSNCTGDFACVGNVCSRTMCRAGFKSCDGRCIPQNGCCNDGQCSGNVACTNNTCSASQCRSGYKRCGSQCIPNATCCEADGCCSNNECGMCQKCVSGRCVNQTANEDLKSECPSATCRTGNCNGGGGCGAVADGQRGPGCDSECRQCATGTCGSSPDGRTCGTSGSCRAGQCVACAASERVCDGRCVAFDAQCNGQCSPAFQACSGGRCGRRHWAFTSGTEGVSVDVGNSGAITGMTSRSFRGDQVLGVIFDSLADPTS